MKIKVDCETCAALGDGLTRALNEARWQEASEYCLDLETHFEYDHGDEQLTGSTKPPRDTLVDEGIVPPSFRWPRE